MIRSTFRADQRVSHQRVPLSYTVTDFLAFMKCHYFLSALVMFELLQLGTGILARIIFPSAPTSTQHFVTIGWGSASKGVRESGIDGNTASISNMCLKKNTLLLLVIDV